MFVGYCEYCDASMVDDPSKPNGRTKDHVVPASMGGRVVIYCCRKCNGEKKNLTVNEWLSLLRSNGDPRVRLLERFMACRMADIMEQERVVAKKLSDPALMAIKDAVMEALWGHTSEKKISRERRSQVHRISRDVLAKLKEGGFIIYPKVGE